MSIEYVGYTPKPEQTATIKQKPVCLGMTQRWAGSPDKIDDPDMMKVYRVTMKCITQGCLHRCTASFFTCKSEPDIGVSFWKPNDCLLHSGGAGWRVASFEEIPELTAILGRRKGE